MMLNVLVPELAQARTRDDVMSGAFRCIAVSNSRQWLDCYYGAAEPMRVQLDLPPAPETQIRIALAPPSGGSIAVDEAKTRDEVMSEAFRCTAIDDDRQWLDCYYGSAQRMRSLLRLSPAPQAQPRIATVPLPQGPERNIPQPNPILGDSGGRLSGLIGSASNDKVTAENYELPTTPPPEAMAKNVDHIISRMVDYKFNSQGIFTVTLANGQVWRQIDGDTNYAKLKLRPDSYIVTIKRGIFGSYKVTIKGIPGLFRARRIT